MSLLSWLKKTVKDPESALPSPARTSECSLTPEAIIAANKEVEAVLNQKKINKRKRGYNFYNDELSAKIARYALEHGVNNCSRKFSKELDKPVNESTVRSIRDRQKRRILKAKKSPAASRQDVAQLEQSLQKEVRGRPLLLGEEMDGLIQTYIRALRDTGVVVNSGTVIAGARAIIKTSDPSLLELNGGPITLTRSWAKSLLERMECSSCKDTASVIYIE